MRHSLHNDPAVLADPAAKRAYNRRLFAVVAPKYFAATRLMSLWRDKAWKRFLMSQLPARVDGAVLDIASGTADLALLAQRRWPNARIFGCDLSLDMMARAHGAARGLSVRFTCQDMAALGIASHSVAVVTGGYALRNAPDLSATLAEIFRVVRPGGAVAFLDFSRSPNHGVFVFQYWLLRLWGGLWGLLLHGNPAVYAYIAESLRLFPDRARLRRMLSNAGFCGMVFHRRMFGLVDIIVAAKP